MTTYQLLFLPLHLTTYLRINLPRIQYQQDLTKQMPAIVLIVVFLSAESFSIIQITH